MGRQERDWHVNPSAPRLPVQGGNGPSPSLLFLFAITANSLLFSPKQE